MSKAITTAEKSVAKAYQAAAPKRFGDLHERMKFLREEVQAMCRLVAGTVPSGPTYRLIMDVVEVMYDLEAEVMYHTPARPPFGQRPIKQ